MNPTIKAVFHLHRSTRRLAERRGLAIEITAQDIDLCYARHREKASPRRLLKIITERTKKP